MSLRSDRIHALISAQERDPFSVLGVHLVEQTFIARSFFPDAQSVEAFTLKGKSIGKLIKIHDSGLFEGAVDLKQLQPIRYKAEYQSGGTYSVADAYSFGPVLGPMDDYFVSEGSHLRMFDKMGAHVIEHEGAIGVHFAVWAPNARRVSVVGDFNQWDNRRNQMRNRIDTGIWEIFVPDVGSGTAYKFEIVGADGQTLPMKADPFAYRSELRPATASVVDKPSERVWDDGDHREFWANADARRQPISIYEVHPGSWRKNGEDFLSWDEMAEQLIPYVLDMGFTHIEFLPISEFPYDPSWGYQTTGLYAPTARFGEPEGFARFVEGAHKVGISVLIDWVPAHFPTDAHGLSRFDGTALYEHEDPRKGFHPDWNTAIFNFGRKEVVSYLVNNALFWAERYHVDGLRVDAVASMLYLDYSREHGEWIPNEFGGRENLEAVDFLKRMNKELYGRHPGVLTMAEESTSWPKVSHPVHEGGLGFGFKWNMGFMNDTLRYLSRDAVHRSHHHGEITFGLMYAFTENFVLPLSHDEVVHGKGSLLNKMSGDDWQKFATLRAYYAFMWGYPGKKLLFMGQEFAQRDEWSEARSLDWHLLEHGSHQNVQKLVRDLNHLYTTEPALHARDCEGEGFEWVLVDASEDSVFAWQRKAPDAAPFVIVSHFTPLKRDGYRIRLPHKGRWKEALNTDSAYYGGSGVGNLGQIETDQDGFVNLNIPPLGTIILKLES